jgi:hypothetical protein
MYGLLLFQVSISLQVLSGVTAKAQTIVFIRETNFQTNKQANKQMVLLC